MSVSTYPTELQVDTALYGRGTLGCQHLPGYILAVPLYLAATAIIISLSVTHVFTTKQAIIGGSVLGAMGITSSPMFIVSLYYCHRYKKQPMTYDRLKQKLIYERDHGNVYLKQQPPLSSINQIATNFNILL